MDTFLESLVWNGCLLSKDGGITNEAKGTEGKPQKQDDLVAKTRT